LLASEVTLIQDGRRQSYPLSEVRTIVVPDDLGNGMLVGLLVGGLVGTAIGASVSGGDDGVGGVVRW
jgi:hypothetical protein